MLITIILEQYNNNPTTRLIEEDSGSIIWTLLQWGIIGGIILYYLLRRDIKKND